MRDAFIRNVVMFDCDFSSGIWAQSLLVAGSDFNKGEDCRKNGYGVYQVGINFRTKKDGLI